MINVRNSTISRIYVEDNCILSLVDPIPRTTFRRDPRSKTFWNLVVEMVSKNLGGCKKAYFFMGGRLTLYQAY